MNPRKVVIELNDDNETYNINWFDVLVFTKENKDGYIANLNVPKAKIRWNNGILPESFEMLNNSTEKLFTIDVNE